MNTTDTTATQVRTTSDLPAAPFSDWITNFLLRGPAAGVVPRDPASLAEWKQIWGHHGERCGLTWRAHEAYLRQAAAERSIQPTFAGRYFAEAIATGR
jgi:hypothetical protein